MLLTLRTTLNVSLKVIRIITGLQQEVQEVRAVLPLCAAGVVFATTGHGL